jgi:hypothetical protein
VIAVTADFFNTTSSAPPGDNSAGNPLILLYTSLRSLYFPCFSRISFPSYML